MMEQTFRRSGRRTARRLAALACAAGLVATGCSSAANSQSGGTDTDTGTGTLEPITIRYADFADAKNNTAEGMRRFSEAVSTASDGKITFEYFYSSALLGANDMAEGVGNGVADMGIVNSTYSPQELPIGNWASTLGSLPSASFPVGALQGSAATAEFYFGSEDMQREFSDRNLFVLAPLYAIQAFDLLCTKPVTTAEEAKGIRVRTGGQTWSKEAEAVGMTPVPLTGAELYEGFQRGLVDCAMVHPPAYIGFGLWEIGKYYTPTRFSGWNAFNVAFNKDFWDGLPTEAKQILWDNAPLFLEGFHAKNFEFYKQFGDEGPTKHGIEFQQVNTGLGDAISAFQQSEIEAMPSSAPPGVSDPQAFIADYRTANEDWLGKVAELGFVETGTAPDDWRRAFQTTYDLEPWTAKLKTDIWDQHRPQ